MLHNIITETVEGAIILFEFTGVIIIIISGAKAVISYIKKDSLTRLKLAQGMATALEFKLGSEILRTVVIRDFTEILIVAAIITLRAALTFLIHWEIKNEDKKSGHP